MKESLADVGRADATVLFITREASVLQEAAAEAAGRKRLPVPDSEAWTADDLAFFRAVISITIPRPRSEA